MINVNSVGVIDRFRYVNLLVAIPRTFSEARLLSALSEWFPKPTPTDIERGMSGLIVASKGRDETMTVASQFTNLAFQGVDEPVLTTFLGDHEQLVYEAFGAKQVWFQQRLPWIEGNPDPSESSIIPDMILLLRSGRWAIVEFKLPLLSRRSITQGGHRRRRFVSTAYEGISQLANYNAYFEWEENVIAATNVLGATVIEPDLILVVGSDENVVASEVIEALRSHRPIEIIDYDSLVRMSLRPIADL